MNRKLSTLFFDFKTKDVTAISFKNCFKEVWYMSVFEYFFKLTLCMISFIKLSTGRVTFGNGGLFVFFLTSASKSLQSESSRQCSFKWFDKMFDFNYLIIYRLDCSHQPTIQHTSTFTGVIGWVVNHKNPSIKSLLLQMFRKCYYQWILSIIVPMLLYNFRFRVFN